MYGLTALDSPPFLIGLALGAAVLCAGVFVGLILSRRGTPQSSTANAPQFVQLVRSLSPVTGVSLEAEANHKQCDELARRGSADAAVQPATNPSAALWMTDLVEANQHLQSRLAQAERTLEQQNGELEKYISAAQTDALTGLPNRRAFDEELTRRFAEWQRQGRTFCVLLVDVDLFKKLNDRYGHLAGDKVLVEVGQVLRGALRETDLVGRFGGEEFAVVLPSSAAGEAKQAAERARVAVENSRHVVDDQVLRVTVSCGVAMIRRDESLEALVERADTALYASKNAGRNFAHWHDGQHCVPITHRTPKAAVVAMLTGGSPLAGLEQHDEFPQVCSDLRRRLGELTAP